MKKRSDIKISTSFYTKHDQLIYPLSLKVAEDAAVPMLNWLLTKRGKNDRFYF